MKYRSNSFLALIPHTKEGELIFKQALYFQKTLKMRVFVLNIFKTPSIISKVFEPKKIKSFRNQSLHDLKDWIKIIVQEEIQKNVIARIKIGDVIPTLINESKKGGYEFILIDKSKNPYKGSLSKSGVDKIVSSSDCPVLTVNKDFPVHDINKIIIPIDISQTTKKRLLWATMFAKKFNAKIQIISALNIEMDETKSLAFKNAEKIKHMIIERGIECEVKILKAYKQEKYKVILDYMEKEKPELVVIRTHQESIFSGTNIGKFVSEIVHGCKMPVFTVNYSKKHLPPNFD